MTSLTGQRVLPIAGLFSGGGRTLLNLLDHIERGLLPARIVVAIASRDDAPGIERIVARGVPVRIASPRAIPDDEDRHDAITGWLGEHGVELVCLCGYLRWLRIDEPYIGRVINIHPALLPKFGGKGMYGLRVHRAVLEAGEQVTGCTVHVVDEQYDHGPTILHRTCPVLPDDDEHTLAARVFEEECRAYPEAVRLFAEDRVVVEGDRVRILPERAVRD